MKKKKTYTAGSFQTALTEYNKLPHLLLLVSNSFLLLEIEMQETHDQSNRRKLIVTISVNIQLKASFSDSECDLCLSISCSVKGGEREVNERTQKEGRYLFHQHSFFLFFFSSAGQTERCFS